MGWGLGGSSTALFDFLISVVHLASLEAPELPYPCSYPGTVLSLERCMSVAASGQVAGAFMTMLAAIVAATPACACCASLGSLQEGLLQLLGTT